MRPSSGAALFFILLLFGVRVSASETSGRDFNRGDAINQPPRVTLTAPEAGATYVAPARVQLKAIASDPDGRVRRVRFYASGELIAVRNGGGRGDGSGAQEYGATWRRVAPGTYLIFAEAEDRDGATTMSAPVQITVHPAGVPTNRPPVANPTTITTAEDTQVGIVLSGSDPDGDALTFSIASQPTHGTLSGIAPNLTYTPAANYFGPDSFTFTVSDGSLSSTQATVTITVAAVDDPPLAVTLTVVNGPFTAPATIRLLAEVSGGEGASTIVEFFEGQSRLGSDDTAPYELVLENVASGQRNIRAVASNGGETASSQVQTITIANALPVISIVSPTDGAEFPAPATITFIANASDPGGTVTRVQFLLAGALETRDAVRGEGDTFTLTWVIDTPGTYRFNATAIDNDGARTTTPFISVIVRARTVEPLVQPANLQYEGAFLLPEFDPTKADIDTFAFGGTALAFNPLGGSLFIVGNDQSQLAAELTIPAINNPVPADLSALNRATVLQPLTDALEGKLDLINNSDTSKKIGGLLPYGTSLYVSAYDYYDGLGSQVLSHFITSTDLSVPDDVAGPFQVGDLGLGAGFVSGYFGLIPSQWQTALGGPVLNGNCCLGVASRSSFGPAVFAIDPVNIGVGASAPAQPLVYYPETQPLAAHDATGPLFNGTSEVKGVVFPEGWRSVLFFGRHGLGEYCYGAGTADSALHATAHPNGVDVYCYDPADDSKGVHAFPYAYYVWAYDALDLASVRNGTKSASDLRPYGLWELNLPYRNDTGRIGGATYDPVSGRIYVSQMYGDTAHPNNPQPVIHVFTVR